MVGGNVILEGMMQDEDNQCIVIKAEKMPWILLAKHVCWVLQSTFIGVKGKLYLKVNIWFAWPGGIMLFALYLVKNSPIIRTKWIIYITQLRHHYFDF